MPNVVLRRSEESKDGKCHFRKIGRLVSMRKAAEIARFFAEGNRVLGNIKQNAERSDDDDGQRRRGRNENEPTRNSSSWAETR